MKKPFLQDAGVITTRTFWDALSDEDKVKLIKYQWKHYKLKLEMWTGGEKKVEIRPSALSYPDLEEIDRIIRQKPTHVKRVV